VAVGVDPLGRVAEVGWTCLAAPDADAGGSCEIDASRAFSLSRDFGTGANLIAPGRFVLRPGGEARLEPAVAGGF
jgi:hypothetical protein